MNGILATVIISLASISAAPAPQDFYSYNTQSVYPHYNIQYQPFPAQAYPTLLPQPAYVQPPLPVSPGSSNSSELQKIEAVFPQTVEKIKDQNERSDAVIKSDEKAEAKSPGTTIQNSLTALNPFIAAGKTSIGADCIGHTFHSADPIFGPEIGVKYEIQYSPETFSSAVPYFSSYSGLVAQPAFSAAYSDFSAYSSYPAFGGSYPFVGFGSGGSALVPSNGNKDGLAPTSSPESFGVSTIGPVHGDAPNLSTIGSENPKELSTTVPNETSSELDFIGAPPSIDGPGKLSKKKRRQGKSTKKV